MNTAATPRALAPADAIAAWPTHRPLAAVIAADPLGRTTASLLAQPTSIARCPTIDEALSATAPIAHAPVKAPFGPGWIVALAYHAAPEIEPAAAIRSPCIHDHAAVIARIDAGWIHDNRTGRWTSFGTDEPLPSAETNAGFTLGPPSGLERADAYRRAAARAVELIHAGDIFQVNLAHRLTAAFTGSPRALAATLIRRLAPWHGAYLETDDIALASASPELFLDLRPDGSVLTRPMKGTRPGQDTSLSASQKDAAELAMIVDLMRNDLGRVCAPGSVRVQDPRAIEPHGRHAGHAPALWQGVATVSGSLRPGMTRANLIRAAFPPGSVTGAPKIRAMQIIDELEPELGFDRTLTARNHYCGAIGFLGDDGSASLAVAIRTAIIRNGLCHFPVGAGIVADSDPDAEWRETLDKAAAFLALCAERPA